jgi:hypothetical protein
MTRTTETSNLLDRLACGTCAVAEHSGGETPLSPAMK